MYEKLKKVLLDEIELYKKILELSKEKTNVIIEGDTKRLAEITRTEHIYIQDAVELERLRISVLKEIKDDENTITLSDILYCLPENERSELNNIRNQLVEILYEQAQINETNSRLININLEFINNLLDKVRKGKTYKADGSISRNTGDAVIVDKRF